jgi:hypothetical protein
MPAKVTKKAAARKIICDAYFHWEFLRRSETYAQDYRKFVEKHGAWLKAGLDPAWIYRESTKRDEDPYSRNSYASSAIQDLREFRTKWDIDPFPPEFTATQEQTQVRPQLNPFLRERKLLVFNYGPATAHIADNSEILTICIDVTGPLTDLLNQVESIIKFRKEAYSQRPPAKRERKRFEVFEEYLRAYDLKKKESKYKDIAEALKLPNPKTAERYQKKAVSWIRRVAEGEW